MDLVSEGFLRQFSDRKLLDLVLWSIVIKQNRRHIDLQSFPPQNFVYLSVQRDPFEASLQDTPGRWDEIYLMLCYSLGVEGGIKVYVGGK